MIFENSFILLTASDLEAVVKRALMEVLAKDEQPSAERLLTVSEVCAMLGVTRSTLWRWAKTGYLVPEKIGSRVRYKESDVKKEVRHE